MSKVVRDLKISCGQVLNARKIYRQVEQAYKRKICAKKRMLPMSLLYSANKTLCFVFQLKHNQSRKYFNVWVMKINRSTF